MLGECDLFKNQTPAVASETICVHLPQCSAPLAEQNKQKNIWNCNEVPGIYWDIYYVSSLFVSRLI